MGVPIEVWRARIGTFGGKSHTKSSQHSCSLVLHCGICFIFHFLIFLLLLVIGNVELNPGPGTSLYPCSLCPFEAKTPQDHLIHQKLHFGVSTSSFSCPVPTCLASFTSYRSVCAHISHHGVPRNIATGIIEAFECPYCETKVAFLSSLCSHFLNDHLRVGTGVSCPVPSCTRSLPFSSMNAFAVHLSLYHPGWRQDTSSVSASVTPQVAPQVLEAEVSSEGRNIDEVHDWEYVGVGSDSDSNSEYDSDSENEVFDTAHSCLFSEEDITAYIANFYAFMEGPKLVPSLTVDKIAQKLAFISEVMRDRLKEQLLKSLESEGVSKDAISRIITSLVSSDPFYNVHHKNAPGDCFLTSHLRLAYYKNHFKFVESEEINVKKNASDREETFQYVPIKETLKVLLEDKSVQNEIEQSFERDYSDTTLIGDYPTGSVFQSANNPKKRLDILGFMDAFTCVNPLGSAKNDPKYKIHGLYITLGNFSPHLRSYLKSMRLVLLVADSILKSDPMDNKKRLSKVFKRFIRDLKDLEKNGIEFKGEMLPVRFQFLQGDNLGQHTLGGFMESFSATYFCRFCNITKEMYAEDKKQDKPVFRMGQWRTHESYKEALEIKNTSGVESYQGIKRDSPLNELEHFKVCDPRLSPCIAHDIFIGGVVDCDMGSMLKYFVDKGWFSYSDLRNRIKRFKYLGSDKRNKPGFINDSGKKLGGHAIQNWTLLRLLPYLIEDKIKPDNKIWKRFLLLKLICEYICAPSLTLDQIENLRFLQKKYMKRRKRLANNYKPKHHYFWHYPDLFLKFGALIYHWTMAFEHRHQFFKKVAKTCGNYINLVLTFAKKFQLLQAFQSIGLLFPCKPICHKAFPFVADAFEGELKDFVKTCHFSANALDVQLLTVNEINYKKKLWLLLEAAPNNKDIYVGQIEILICDGLECKAIVSKHRSQLWPEYGIYKIIVQDDPVYCLVSLQSIQNPSPHAVYSFKNNLTFSLKHVFPHMMCSLP